MILEKEISADAFCK